MTLEGFTPYAPEAATLYEQRRWWLGLTLGQMLDKAADVYPQREALVGAGQRYTYAELRRATDRLAIALVEQGFQAGDRVLLQLPNWAEFVVAYFALQKAGLVMVLLTVNHSAREIAHLAELTRPKGWILPASYRNSGDYLALAEQIRDATPGLTTVILAGEGSRDVVGRDGYLCFHELLEPAVDEAELRTVLDRVAPDPGEVALLLPSGGTTGLPKLAPRTHNDFICNVEYKSRAWDVNATDTCLVATTVGHNLALLVTISGPIFHGAKVVLLDSTRPADACAIIQEERVTCAGLVPTLMSRIVHYEGLADYDLASLCKVYVGAANSPPDLVRAVEDKLGARYTNAFGMVEGPCSQTRPEDSLEVRTQTIGRPVCPYDQLVTLGDDGRPTAVGTEGELAARGPGVFTGYFKNPQANQSAFTPDGFFRTGDLAVLDAGGNLRITGRIKDIILRGGENIAARDVEDLISSHPAVEYVAAVGMPDQDLGEAVCAYIKPANGGISHQEVVRHMEQLGAGKALIPARTEVVASLPLTAAGKADKKVLRKDIEAKLQAETR